MDSQNKSNETQYNIFSLPDADQLGCVVKSYTINHAVMVLKIIDFTNQNNRLLEFQSVQYFSGPVSWASANFQLRPWQECIQLLVTLNRLPGLEQLPQHKQQDIGKKQFQLYVVSALDCAMEIKIVAASAALL